jgi:dephospho-CoA kinase
MTHDTKNAKIVAFVGLAGAGKTTAVEYLTQKGIPKVNGNDIIDEVNGLVQAGQHHIVIDGDCSWNEYKKLKHEFPGELHVVALLAPKHARHHRLLNRDENPLSEADANESDWSGIEQSNIGGPIAMADRFIINDGNIEKLHESIDRILADIEFSN